MTRPNPLLQPFDLFPYAQVQVADLQPAIQHIVEASRTTLATILAREADTPSWNGLVLAVEELDKRLDDTFYALVPLAFTNEAWGAAVDACDAERSAYRAEKYRNLALFNAYKRLEVASLTVEQHTVLKLIIRDFKLGGANLAVAEQALLARQVAAIVGLEASFRDNLGMASAQWSKHITDVGELAGVPDADLAIMQHQAQASERSGWLLTLDETACKTILRYAERRELRKELYLAYATRASDQVPGQSQYDNAPVLQALLRLRHEKAQLMGFSNFAELSLETKAAQSTAEVETFLNRLIARDRPRLEREADQLRAFAQQQGCDDLQPWDYEFYAQKMRQRGGSDPDQVLCEYFSYETALNGLIELAEQLYGISIDTLEAEAWHPAVRVLQITEAREVLGHIYLDTFSRPGKPAWPWSFAMRNRHVNTGGDVSRPVAVLFGDYATEGMLFGHLDLRKLFHEFHHCLHQILMTNDHRRLNSIHELGHGVTEFAGKLLEQWCWSAQAMQPISRHRTVGESASLAAIQQWLAARETQRGLEDAEELKKASLDFGLHRGHGDRRSIEHVTADVCARTQVLPLANNERFANGFDYMVTGYEAGYYCYLWAEEHAAVVFAWFRKYGVADQRLGQAMRDELLAPGASRSMAASIQAFLDRAQSIVSAD
ncbi:M3 family metallopeptidase [Pseudomonas sp. GZD-222]|uniref:M3 family metallopeptidase n=1 Tax=Pseudomonas sp. GZD-222 TaxID=3404805 RepID=UPI003BB60390